MPRLKTRLLVTITERRTIALGEQREQHLGFVVALLHVAQIVEQDHLEEVELAEDPRQVEVTFGAEQFLHQGVGRDAQHVAAGLDQRVPDGAQPVAFADAGQTEGVPALRAVGPRRGAE